MVVRLSPAANILDILVLIYKFLWNGVKILKTAQKYMHRMSRHVDG